MEEKLIELNQTLTIDSDNNLVLHYRASNDIEGEMYLSNKEAATWLNCFDIELSSVYPIKHI